MNTEADKHRDEAVLFVSKAIKEIAEIIINECEGSKDFTESFRAKLKEGLNNLISVRDSLS